MDFAQREPEINNIARELRWHSRLCARIRDPLLDRCGSCREWWFLVVAGAHPPTDRPGGSWRDLTEQAV